MLGAGLRPGEGAGVRLNGGEAYLRLSVVDPVRVRKEGESGPLSGDERRGARERKRGAQGERRRALGERKEVDLLEKKEVDLLEKKEADLLEKKEADLLEKKEADLHEKKEADLHEKKEVDLHEKIEGEVDLHHAETDRQGETDRDHQEKIEGTDRLMVKMLVFYVLSVIYLVYRRIEENS